MKYLLYLSLAFSLFNYKSNAQDYKSIIKSNAQLMIDATVKEDYATVLDYTYPPIIKAHGGKDSVLIVITDGFKKMKEQGNDFAIKSASIGEPGDEIKLGDLYYSVIPEKVVVKFNGKSYITTSSVVAISSDNTHWTFVDTAGLNDLKLMRPEIDKLSIPKGSGPTLLKD